MVPNILDKYKFENINDNDKIIELEKKVKNLNELLKKKSKIKKSDVTYGQVFDIKLFNAKVNEVNDITRKKNKIRDQIKLSRLNYRPPNPGRLTITEFKQGLLLDTYHMFKDFTTLKKINYNDINNILNKNYRRLTLLIILLIICIISYILIKFLSDV
jgi:hypothetical protein